MSKSNKKNTTQTRNSTTKSLGKPNANTDPSKTDNNHLSNGIPIKDTAFALISFDTKVKRLLFITLGLFFILVLAKINYSSISIWNQVLPDGSDLRRGLISGTPKQIRMDDWAGGTPMTMSQVNNNFALVNPSLGGEMPSMVCGVPNKHFSTLFRPENWGYIAFGLEHGFAWRWNFVVFAGFLAIFFTFLILTRNKFWLSLFGAFWLTFSPGIAWWSLNNLTFLYSGCTLLIASLHIFYSKSIKSLLLACTIYIWSFVVFCLLLYPPYQVPIGYMLIILLIGFLWRNFHKEILFNQLGYKILLLTLSLITIISILYFYYKDAKSTIEIMSNTVYPGRRSETGGTGFVANWLSEYFSGWLLSEQSIPKGWMNICELSHFVTLTPTIALCCIAYFSTQKKVDPLLTMLIAFIAILMIWIEVGFPSFLAKLTLIDMSPTRRTQVPLGIANVFTAVLYLAYIDENKIKLPSKYSFLIFAFIVIFMFYAVWLNITDSQGYYKVHQLFIPTIFFIVLNSLLVPYIEFAGKEIIVAGLLAVFTLPSLKINPIGIGMSPITENAFYQKVNEIHQKDKSARWAVFGNQYLTYIVTATGANQLSGMKYMPDYKTMRVLDPQAKRDSAYNRFAHVVYSSYIDGKDSVVIFNPYEDAYTVAMDGCSPKLKILNTKYFVFDKAPQPVEVRCMTLLSEMGNIRIYKRNDF